MAVFCTRCGAQNEDLAQTCTQCQAVLPVVGGYQPGYQPIQPPVTMYGQAAMQDWKQMGADKKIAAGICGILIGSLGVHKFVLGYTTEGVIMLLVSLLTCGLGAPIMSIIGIVEGIMYLTKPDEDFVRTYIQGRTGWF